MCLKLLGFAVIAATLTLVRSDDCGDSTNWLANKFELTVDECPDRSHLCYLVHNHNLTVTIKIQARKDLKHVEANVSGILRSLHLKLPFLDGERNACHRDMKCPLRKGEEGVYKAHIFIQPWYPRNTRVDVLYELKTGHETIGCAVIPSEIVHKKPHHH